MPRVAIWLQAWTYLGSNSRWKIWESNKQKLLDLQIDRNLNFNEYVLWFCKKGGKKLPVLAILSNFMSIKQRKVLMKSFIESQFGDFPLIWIFHVRGVNNKINQLHECLLHIVYKDNNSSIKKLLKKDNSFTVHHRNIQSLATELRIFRI